MTTFADMIADLESDLYSFVQGNDQANWLTAGIDADDLTLSVDDASIFDAGYAEITSSTGNELVYIVSKDEQANTLTLPPWGRAQRGTTALVHPIDSRIVADPQFPRYKLAQFINEAISDLYPSIFCVAFEDIGLDYHVQVYNLPVVADGLISVLISSDYRPERGADPLRRMRFNPADKTIDIAGAARDNNTMRVTYRCAPLPFVALTDTLDDVGFGDQLRSTVRLFAYYKALNALQGQKLQLSSVEATVMTQLRQPDFLNNTIKTVFAQLQLSMQLQQDRLRQIYPPLRYRIR